MGFKKNQGILIKIRVNVSSFLNVKMCHFQQNLRLKLLIIYLNYVVLWLFWFEVFVIFFEVIQFPLKSSETHGFCDDFKGNRC